MKRSILLIALSALLLLCIPLNVAADSDLPLVIDNANLLDTPEETLLDETARSIQKEFDIDVVILTIDTLQGYYAQDFADAFYDTNGYREDGVLFLLAMAEREWYISTCGSAIGSLTDYGIQQLGESAVTYFSNGYYGDGFQVFLAELRDYLSADVPIDGYADYSGDYYHGEREDVYYYEEDTSPNLILSLFIGIIVAAVAVGFMRSAMNTRRAQRGANAYLTGGAFRLHTHQDLFLYSNVSKVRRQQPAQQSSGHRGGGSSVHRSSGGRRHGGGGGRF